MDSLEEINRRLREGDASVLDEDSTIVAQAWEATDNPSAMLDYLRGIRGPAIANRVRDNLKAAYSVEIRYDDEAERYVLPNEFSGLAHAVSEWIRLNSGYGPYSLETSYASWPRVE